MGIFNGFVVHWFDLLQSAGIIGGLLFTAYSIRKDNQARRISNLNAIADRHREIWQDFYSRPQFSRVLDAKVDLSKVPISQDEELFVNLLVVHLDSVHRAIKAGLFVKIEGLKQDISGFFALPIPRAVWEKYKHLLDRDFMELVESALK